jgi:hypothetical protein
MFNVLSGVEMMSESLNQATLHWLMSLGINETEILYVVIWQHPAHNICGIGNDFEEIVAISRDRGKAAIAYVEFDKKTIKTHNDEVNYEEDNLYHLEFNEITCSELASWLADSVTKSVLSFQKECLTAFEQECVASAMLVGQ